MNQRDANNIADGVLDLIRKTLQPEELFGEEELIEWARDKEPQDIFEEKALKAWAEANGYVEEE